MTIAVDLGRKATKQTNKQTKTILKVFFHNYNLPLIEAFYEKVIEYV